MVGEYRWRVMRIEIGSSNNFMREDEREGGRGMKRKKQMNEIKSSKLKKKNSIILFKNLVGYSLAKFDKLWLINYECHSNFETRRSKTPVEQTPSVRASRMSFPKNFPNETHLSTLTSNYRIAAVVPRWLEPYFSRPQCRVWRFVVLFGRSIMRGAR